MIALVPVTAAAVAHRIPEGFRALTPAEAGLPPDVRDAVLGLRVFDCRELNGASVDVFGAGYGALFVPVEPPAHFRVANVSLFHAVKWDVIVGKPLRSALNASGVSTADGFAGTDLAAQVNEANFDRVAHSTPSGASFVTVASAQPDGSGWEHRRFADFTPTANGLARWEGGIRSARVALAPGTLELEPGSEARRIVGSDVVAAYVYTGGEAGIDSASVEILPTGHPS